MNYMSRYFIHYAVKPVFRVSLGRKKKWPYKTGDLLREDKYI